MIVVLHPDPAGVWRADRLLIDTPDDRPHGNHPCTDDPIMPDGWLTGDSVSDAWRSFRAEWFA